MYVVVMRIGSQARPHMSLSAYIHVQQKSRDLQVTHNAHLVKYKIANPQWNTILENDSIFLLYINIFRWLNSVFSLYESLLEGA